jgi:addiction module RelE/StbE family toxin
MWRVFESSTARKVLAKAPKEVREKYDVWQSIVKLSGPPGLRVIKGFHDEALKGNWKGYRSSRLNIQYRVIYHIDGDEVAVYVLDITGHDYRRR